MWWRTTCVKRIGFGQKPADDPGQRRAHLRPRKECIRINACFPHPGNRQVDASAGGILADIARNIGELHGKAELGPALQNMPLAPAHDEAHHDVDEGGEVEGHVGGLGWAAAHGGECMRRRQGTEARRHEGTEGGMGIGERGRRGMGIGGRGRHGGTEGE